MLHAWKMRSQKWQKCKYVNLGRESSVLQVQIQIDQNRTMTLYLKSYLFPLLLVLLENSVLPTSLHPARGGFFCTPFTSRNLTRNNVFRHKDWEEFEIGESSFMLLFGNCRYFWPPPLYPPFIYTEGDGGGHLKCNGGGGAQEVGEGVWNRSHIRHLGVIEGEGGA